MCIYKQSYLTTIYHCRRTFLNGSCLLRRCSETTADGVPRYHILELHLQFPDFPFLTPPLRCRTTDLTQTTACRSVLRRSYGIREQWIHFCNGYYDVYYFLNSGNNIFF